MFIRGYLKDDHFMLVFHKYFLRLSNKSSSRRVVVNWSLIRTNSVATCVVVSQVYDTDVNKEYVIRGNAAVLKCQVPSFVADFVTVVSWHTDLNEDFYPSSQIGNFCSVGNRQEL